MQRTCVIFRRQMMPYRASSDITITCTVCTCLLCTYHSMYRQKKKNTHPLTRTQNMTQSCTYDPAPLCLGSSVNNGRQIDTFLPLVFFFLMHKLFHMLTYSHVHDRTPTTIHPPWTHILTSFCTSITHYSSVMTANHPPSPSSQPLCPQNAPPPPPTG